MESDSDSDIEPQSVTLPAAFALPPPPSSLLSTSRLIESRTQSLISMSLALPDLPSLPSSIDSPSQSGETRISVRSQEPTSPTSLPPSVSPASVVKQKQQHYATPTTVRSAEGWYIHFKDASGLSVVIVIIFSVKM